MKRLAVAIIIIAAIVLAGSIAYEFYKTATPGDASMKLTGPKEGTPANPNSTVTILLGRNNFIFAYRGSDMAEGKILDSTSTREYLIQMKNDIPKKDFVVIIKQAPYTTYESTIHMLKEMTNNNIERYAVTDIFKSELRVVDSLNK